MAYQELIDKFKSEIEIALAQFKEEIYKIRASHLSPAFVEDIKAECFGSVLPLKQLGAISSVSSRELSIQLWDKSYVESVVRAIESHDLNLGIRVDEATVYLSSSSLNEETRNNLIRLLNQKKEEAFQHFRRLRDKFWKDIQDGFQKGEIREDDKFKARDKLDDIVRDYKDKLDELEERKEGEIMG